MTDIFLSLLNVSITATWVALAVLLLRVCMKKAPKWITCLLWGVVGLRLLLPFSFESTLSLIPSAQTVPGDITLSQNPAIYSGITAVDQAVNPVIMEQFAPQELTGVNPAQNVLLVCSVAWLVGMAVMLLYGVVSSVKLYRTVRVSVGREDNIYLCDNVDTPFILGVFTPRIYLPSGMDLEQNQAVIAHEKAHLQRKDHWWKPVGFVLLTIYWFNPVLWVAYILLCRDIELACDEKVIKSMDAAAKRAYSQALVDCSCNRRTIMACPLAFGEVGVKARIKAVLRYKKPAAWIIGAAAVTAVVLLVCFLTDPLPCEHVYTQMLTKPATCTEMGEETFTCEICYHSYNQPVTLLEHSYGEGMIAQTSTCTQEGEKQFTCSGCGHIKTEPVPVVEHSLSVFYVRKEPNCTATGEKVGKCLVCEQEYVVEVLPQNDVHEMQLKVIKTATCESNGEGENVCSRCGKTESHTFVKHGHDYKDFMTIPATCATEGEKQQICQICGKERRVSIPIDPDAHSWIYNYCSNCDARKEGK